jgi:hypothetical protein
MKINISEFEDGHFAREIDTEMTNSTKPIEITLEEDYYHLKPEFLELRRKAYVERIRMETEKMLELTSIDEN